MKIRKNYNIPKTKFSTVKKVITVTFPVKLDHSYYVNKQYTCKIFYKHVNGKDRQKTVFFGFRKHNNQENNKHQRNQTNIKGKRKSRDDPFHPYFWQERLLTKDGNFEDLFIKTLKELKVIH